MILLIVNMCMWTAQGMACVPSQEVEWYDRDRKIIAFPSPQACAERRDWIEGQKHAYILSVGCYNKGMPPPTNLRRGSYDRIFRGRQATTSG